MPERKARKKPVLTAEIDEIPKKRCGAMAISSRMTQFFVNRPAGDCPIGHQRLSGKRRGVTGASFIKRAAGD
ncbi:MAG: hypothetical protein JSS81_27760 [Acidobacteria bacterium]|nr:hypothetical protein [Acidobacteriota bacterium]